MKSLSALKTLSVLFCISLLASVSWADFDADSICSFWTQARFATCDPGELSDTLMTQKRFSATISPLQGDADCANVSATSVKCFNKVNALVEKSGLIKDEIAREKCTELNANGESVSLVHKPNFYQSPTNSGSKEKAQGAAQ